MITSDFANRQRLPKILFHSDLSSHLALFGRMLEQFGETIVTASTVKEALELSAEGDVSLLMTEDIGLVRLVHKNEKLTETRIIVVSANFALKATALEAGADDFLLMPFPMSALRDSIDKLF